MASSLRDDDDDGVRGDDAFEPDLDFSIIGLEEKKKLRKTNPISHGIGSRHNNNCLIPYTIAGGITISLGYVMRMFGK